MKAVNTTIRLGVACAVLMGAAGCSSTPRYVHAVFFTCKPGTPDSEIESLVADGYKLLAQVPSVRQLESGRRDLEAVRDVNVKDYDVGLVVYFDDRAGHDVYAQHPRHLEYIDRHKSNWETVRVFDFIAK
jgi:hypothetical protein